MNKGLFKEEGSRQKRLFEQRNFLLLWIGEATSVLGSQFNMIALPWLVLQLTGNALAMGTVLAVAGIPRAFFMLIGGVLIDRFSSRSVMLVSNILRMILVALLAGLVLTGGIELWMLYLLALIFGLIDAFFLPASRAIVPELVEKEQLEAANAVIQGTVQFSMFVGPALAGALIGLLAMESQASGDIPEMQGIGIAFVIDALTFLVSLITLWFMKTKQTEEANQAPRGPESLSVWLSIREGLVSVWNNLTLRLLFFAIAGVNLLFNGPFLVGIPVLADSRLPEGATAFGLIMSAYGAGSLLGIALAGTLPKPAPQRMGPFLVGVASYLGIGLIGLAFVSSTVVALPITLTMGIANGYISIIFITWIQNRTPQAMLGRIISLLMFASVALIPLSMALSGALIEYNMTALFIGAGSLLTLMLWPLVFHPAMRAMGMGQSKIKTA